MAKKNETPVAEAPTAAPADVLAMAGGSAVADPFAALGLPSMLDEVLNEVMSNTGYDENLGDGEARLQLAYAAFPQKEGKYRADGKYKIYIGTRDDNPMDEKLYHKEVAFLMIDPLLIRNGRGKSNTTGGRLMWPFTETGERDLEGGVACQSIDGITPLPKFVGSEIFDYRVGKTFKIGYTVDPVSGKPVPMDTVNICSRCPAASWIKVGNKSVQLCKNNWAWVIGAFIDGKVTMVKVSGGNNGIQMALEGRSGNPETTIGLKQDGSALPGIEHFFISNGKRKIVVPVVDGKVNLSPLQLQFVTAISPDEQGDVTTQATAVTPQGARNETFYTALASGQVKSVILEVPTYPYAPQGRPEHVGSFDVPVYPVIMTAVPNNFKLNNRPNPTSVPDFRVGTEPLTAEQYAAFLTARHDYVQNDMRSILMGKDTHKRVQELLDSHRAPQISVEPQPALPSGAAPAEEVVEGTFTVSDVAIDE